MPILNNIGDTINTFCSMENGIERNEWDVLKFITSNVSCNFATILLNEALNKDNSQHFMTLWSKAVVRISVDGGTNSFYELVSKCGNEDKVKQTILPQIISGDFDSIKPEVKEYYQNLGVKIIHTPDQNDTDFTKSLLVLKTYLESKCIKIDHAIVYSGNSSTRFDHTVGNLQTLLKMEHLLSFPVINISGNSLIWVLKAGQHTLYIPCCVLSCKEHSWCGFASLSETSIVTTKGLKWDVVDAEISFGKMISTSNTYSEASDGQVIVECSNPLLWFMGWTL